MWEEERRDEKTWDELRRAEKSWENVRRTGKIWEALTGEEWWRAEKSWIETSCVERSSWQELRRQVVLVKELLNNPVNDMRRDEKSCDQRRQVEKRREDMRWDEMRWDDAGCSNHGMQWAVSKRSCDAMRSYEMKKTWKDPTLKSQEFVVAKRRRCPHPISTFCVPLYRL